MTRAIRFLGILWIAAGSIIILASYVMIWLQDGIWKLLDILSPWNVVNWVAVVLTLAPGLLLLHWAERRDRKPPSSQ